MSYMKCPSCGFSIHLRAARLTVDRCPRCLARRGMAVPMSESECRTWPVTDTESASIESRTRPRPLEQSSEPPDAADAADVAAHKFEKPIVKELSREMEHPRHERRQKTSNQSDPSPSDTSTEPAAPP
jgi:hypothetical protein